MSLVHAWLRMPLARIREQVARRRYGIPNVRSVRVGDARFDFLIATVEGHRWYSLVTDFICSEGAATAYFADHVGPGSVVVDVGAHHGLYTMAAASLMHGNGCVVALEAEPANVEIIEENVALNRFSNVRAQSGFVGDGSRGPEGTPTGALDDLLGDLNPTLIKIDVEGAENSVLRGAKTIVKRARPRVLCELHPAKGADVAGILRFFRSRSYKLSVVYEKDPTTVQGLPPADDLGGGNDILVAEPIR